MSLYLFPLHRLIEGAFPPGEHILWSFVSSINYFQARRSTSVDLLLVLFLYLSLKLEFIMLL